MSFLYSVPQNLSADYIMSFGESLNLLDFSTGNPTEDVVFFDVTVEMADDVTGTYVIEGEQISFEDGDTISFEIPPITDAVILFYFAARDPDNPDNPDIMGRLSFSNIDLPDDEIRGDLVQFGSSDGVRRVAVGLAGNGLFPAHGNTEGKIIKSTITQSKNLYLGTKNL